MTADGSHPPESRLPRDTCRSGCDSLFTTMAEAMTQLVSYTDRNLIYRYVNAAYERFFDAPREALLGRPIREIIGERAFAQAQPNIRRVLQGEPVEYEKDLVYRKTLVRRMHARLTPDVDEHGDVCGYVAIIEDITDAETEQSLFRNLTDNIPGLVFRVAFHPDGSITYPYLGPRCEDLLGVSEETIRQHAKEFLDYIHPEDVAAFEHHIQKSVQDGELFDLEYRLQREDGAVVWVRTAAQPQLRDDGAVLMDGVALDVTETRELQRRLDLARMQAECAQKAKQEFLTNMSHELRTPLHGVLGLAELTLCTELDTEQRTNLELIRDSGKALQRVLDDVLDFSHIESGVLELAREEFSLAENVLNVIQLFHQEARQKGVALDWTMDDDVPDALVGDPARLRQMLVNLVGNAVKFTEVGGVTVQVTAAPPRDKDPLLARRVAISVRDTGCGVPASKLEAIFEGFTQADSSLTRAHPGAGLGLAITRRIAQLMDGDLLVESEVGQGSTFTLAVRFEQLATLEPQPDAADAAVATPLDILVAEDTMVNMLLLKRMLEREGHHVVTATNGFEVLEVLPQQRFDCVLLDIQMPGMDGVEAFIHIRSETERWNPEIPVIAVTAHALDGDRERFLNMGMDDYLPKPLEYDALRKALAKVPRSG